MSSEGQALVVLAEVAERAHDLAGKLQTALETGEEVRTTISEAIARAHAAKARFKETRAELSKAMDQRDDALGRAAEASDLIERAGRRIAELEKLSEYGVEDEQLVQELGRALTLRNEKEVDRDRFRGRVDAAEKRVAELESLMKGLQQEIEDRAVEAKEAQKALPDPHLFAWLGLAHLGRANAHFLLDQSPANFDRTIRVGVGHIRQLHEEMRMGRYRLDRFGDLLAGRHESTVQALYASLGLGDLKMASELFSLSADPSMLFHQIFNVFRTWLVGGYLLGDKQVLARLLRTHRFDRGLWRAYCMVFRGLLEGNVKEATHGLEGVLRIEQRPEDLAAIPGIGLVHLPALGLARLMRMRKFPVDVDHPQLPPALLSW